MSKIEFTVKLPEPLVEVFTNYEEYEDFEVKMSFYEVDKEVIEFPVCLGEEDLPSDEGLSGNTKPFIKELNKVSEEVKESYFKLHYGNLFDVLKVINKYKGTVSVVEDKSL